MGVICMIFYAHSTTDASKQDWQTLAGHLFAVARLASMFAAVFGGERAAWLAGILHDIGKYLLDFQRRLEGASDSVDHATPGAVVVSGLLMTKPEDRLLVQILAYAIAGHHGGLPDWLGMGNGRGLKDRLAECDTSRLAPQWRDEIPLEAVDLLPANFTPDKQVPGFQLAFLGRMLFSTLVDADFKDTEAFYGRIDGTTADRQWPALRDCLAGLRQRFDDHMAAFDRTPQADSEVNTLRRTILSHVRERAALPAGVFTLTVPTGGGKTLASLGFALDHAASHDHRRIIYAIPFTSIIDQTAAIFRKVLGDEVVLEHHSALDEPTIIGREAKDKLRLAMADWAAPVIVTTTVQLFESLFANRPSRCRKLHNIAGSIIILDEAQTLPLGLLKPSVLALKELARNYGCTIVLCTATQPALDQQDYPADALMGLEVAGRELAPDPAQLAQRLRRVRFHDAGVLSDEQLCDQLAEAAQGLVIVNGRRHALEVFELGGKKGLEGMVHLTTRQCAAHRRQILADVRDRLRTDQPCRVVATSLIEAGVDVDFPRVWRAEAGLDQIAQAAGRCNREGLRPTDDSVVSIFQPAEAPPLKAFAPLIAAFRHVAARHQDWLSPAAIRAYFQEVYWQKGDGLDAEQILTAFRIDRSGVDFAYRSVAERFRMISTALVPVIIPFDARADEAIKKLSVAEIPSGMLARALQAYIVQVPDRDRGRLIENGHVAFVAPDLRGQQFPVLQTPKLYETTIGLRWEDADYLGDSFF